MAESWSFGFVNALDLRRRTKWYNTVEFKGDYYNTKLKNVYNLHTALLIVSNIHIHVAMVQSYANHMQLPGAYHVQHVVCHMGQGDS